MCFEKILWMKNKLYSFNFIENILIFFTSIGKQTRLFFLNPNPHAYQIVRPLLAACIIFIIYNCI